MLSERYRQRTRRPAQLPLSVLPEGPLDPRTDADDQLGAEFDVVLAAFDRLPPTTRALVRMRVQDGCSFEELAVTFQTSAETLRKRFERALRWVRAVALRSERRDGGRR